MPYKVWAVNEILTAADMNDYVGNQTVLSFAGTAARATAIGTPVEGMVSYVGSGVVEVYAGTATGWTQISGGGGGVTVGTAAPSSPSEGDMWWDSDDGKLFVYYDDGSSQQWVDAAGPSVAVQSTAPTGYEGQLWLDSTDGSMYTYYTDPGGTASSWIGAVSRSGGILQVVSTVKSDAFSSATVDTWVDLTDVSVDITPRSTSSKIYLIAEVGHQDVTTATAIGYRFTRNGAAVGVGDQVGSSRRRNTFARIPNAADRGSSLSGTYLDSPSTTSTITYKLQFMNMNSGTLYINRRNTDNDADDKFRSITTITAIEVAG